MYCQTRENVTCDGCSLYTHRRLQQVTVNCSTRSCYNKVKKKIVKIFALSIMMSKRSNRVSLFFHTTRSMNSEVNDILEFSYLHQCSFHCHREVLDEENDASHLWYFLKRIGSSRFFSRFTVETVHICKCCSEV